MPARSAKQYRLMQMVAHGKKPSNFAGPSKAVAEEIINKTPAEKKSLFAKKKKN